MASLRNSKRKKFHIIYQITNCKNNKIYIGAHSTDNINDGYLGSGKLISRAIKRHGPDNFDKEILFIFENPEEMFSKEKEIVNEEFVSRSDVYNIVTGGFGGFNKGSKNLKHITNNDTGEVIAVHRGKLGQYLNDGWSLGGHAPYNKEKKYVYKDDLRITINEEDIDLYLNNGWNLGYKESPTKEKIWIYNPDAEKYSLCHKNELEHFLNNGWIKKKWAPASCWINNGHTNKRVSNENFEKFILNGWNKGRISSRSMKEFQTKNMSEKVTCPYCYKEGQRVSMARWHFENCKKKS